MSTPFPDNSDRSKDPATNYNQVKAGKKADPIDAPKIEETDGRPKVGRIVSEGSSAIQRKTPLGTKLKNFFLGDSAHSVVDYIVHDVLIPAAKDAVADAVGQGIEKRLYGEVRSASRRTGHRPSGGLSSNTNSNGPRVSYDRYSSPAASRPASNAAPSRRSTGGRYDIGQIIIPTRAEAVDIIEMMFNIVNQYEVVTVAELYEMANLTSNNYMDRNHGWTNLRGAQVVRVRDGYLLDLPTPEALER